MSYHMTLQAIPANTGFAMSAARPLAILRAVINAIGPTVASVRHWLIQHNRRASLAALNDHTLTDIGVHRASISPAPCAPATPIRRTSPNGE